MRRSRSSRRSDLLDGASWLLGRLAIVLVAGIAGLTVALLIAQPDSRPAAAPGSRPVIASRSPAPSATASLRPLSRPSPTAPATPSPSPEPSPTAQDTPGPSPEPSPAPPVEASPQPEATPIVHTMTSGETVRAIARQYGVTVAQIVALNQLEDRNLILVGQTLLIPARNE
jgi:ABC-type uncharacterized transport system involved in gliding motility auxiliary subunit